MLEAPAIGHRQIADWLAEHYGLMAAESTFLALGADPDTAVYRVLADDATPYFLKLRRGHFPEATVRIPHWLTQAGMQQLIAPIPSRSGGALWAPLGAFAATLAPFVSGEAGWGVALSEAQWSTFSLALRALHTAQIPPALLRTIPRESYTARWREQVRTALRQTETPASGDPAAAGLAQLLRERRRSVEQLVGRAELLAGVLLRQPPELCLCHGDIHAGNLLIDTAGRLYIVDWDTLLMAPKERDLMFIGAGIGGMWDSDGEAERFYQGYGAAAIDPTALVYYRYERIVQDIAVACELLLDSGAGGAGRITELAQLAGQFAPGSVVDIACATDRQMLGAQLFAGEPPGADT